jgi:acyl transferase domain-containing protein
MDNNSVTITVPRSDVASLMRHLEEKGAMAKEIGLTGRYHHAGHVNTLCTLFQLCDSTTMLRFPKGRHPLVPLHQNINGEVTFDNSLLHETVLRSILTEKADWYSTITKAVSATTEAAQPHCIDSKAEGKGPWALCQLGLVDCIPRSVLAGTSVKLVRPTTNRSPCRNYHKDAIAVIGLSSQFSDIESPEELWEVIRNRTCTSDVPFSNGGFFDSGLFRKSPREAEYMDPQQRLALHLAYKALESAGYFSPSSTSTDDVGCYLGISSGDYEDHVNSRPPTAYSFTGTARSFASGRISHFFGLTGPSLVIDTACSSSGVAIHTAMRAVQSGECAMALAGGVNLMSTDGRAHQNLAGASFLGHKGQCRPFDATADGYRRGQGGGFVLLKRLSAAVADNNRILGVLAASAVNNNKGASSITLPSSESQSALYLRVLGAANVEPCHVSYVEAHGTGTQKGDPVECKSIRSVFGREPGTGSSPLRFGSVKGNIGHCEAASGIASLIKVLLMLKHRLIPPQANFSTLNPAIAPLEDASMEIPVKELPWSEPFPIALVTNYGASGANAAMIVCPPPMVCTRPAAIPTIPTSRRFPILITANTAFSLRQNARALCRFIETRSQGFHDEHLASFAFHLASRQKHTFPHRTSFLVASAVELKNRLHTLAEIEDTGLGITTASSSKSAIKPVILLFSGQSGRRPNVNRDVYLSFRLLRYHLDRCDRTLQALGLGSLFPDIFNTDPVGDLVLSHCMQFSVQYSVAAAWIDAGLAVATLVGHSFGQLTALCVSGVLNLCDAMKAISGRAMLIQSRWGEERGCMLSVDADVAHTRELVLSTPGENRVDIACHNSPRQQVVAGTAQEISAFENIAAIEGVSTRQLAVTHAFHSKLVDKILPEYHQLLQGLDFRSGSIPIEACSELGGSWHNVKPELVAQQTREPVYFVDALSRIQDRFGSCVFLDVGPGTTAMTIARRALGDQPPRAGLSHSFYATQLDSTEASNSLADTVLGLWNEGISVQFWLYHASQMDSFSPMDLPSYQFEKTQHWLPFVERHTLSECSSQRQLQSSQEKLDLVTYIGGAGANENAEFKFSINQQSDEYALFVRGRKVFGHTLAPGSVLAESAARAFRLLPKSANFGDLSSAPLELGHLKLQAPFGLDLQRHLRLTLRRQGPSKCDFVVECHPSPNGADQSTRLLASGTVGLQGGNLSHVGASPTLLRRLFDHCDELLDHRHASIAQGVYVKRMMGRVATYDDNYLGIRLIASSGLKAVAKVERLPILSQCRDGAAMIPPLFDNFLLAAEMHASSLGSLADDSVYICNGFDSIVPHASTWNSESRPEGPWKVLSTMEQEHNGTVFCDILVFSEAEKSLSLSILGARLIQIPVRSLQLALEKANSPTTALAENGNGTQNLSPSDVTPQPSYLSSPSSFSHTEEVPVGGSTHLYAGGSDQAIDRGLGSALSPLGSTDSLSQPTSTGSSGESEQTSLSSSKSSDSRTSLPMSEHDAALYGLLSDHLGCSNGVSLDIPLGDLGLDSLVAIQFRSDMEKLFGNARRFQEIDENTTLRDLYAMVSETDIPNDLRSESLPMKLTRSSTVSYRMQGLDNDSTYIGGPMAHGLVGSGSPNILSRAVSEFKQVKKATSLVLKETGFAGFDLEVHQHQKLLVLAYILEAFCTLGCDIKTLQAGAPLPSFAYLSKYERLVKRIFEILQEAGVVTAPDRQLRRHRTEAPLPLPPAWSSKDLYRQILEDFPAYQVDHQLLNTTASRLADCLSGRADPLQLLFQSQEAASLLEGVYISSPMFSTGNTLLSNVLNGVLSDPQLRSTLRMEKIRILEIGAGTGATTRRILDQLLACGIGFTYTFSDISLALVNASRKKFGTLYDKKWVEANMEFITLDIEKSPPANMLQSYNLVVSSNCIHATKDLQQSCVNIEKLVCRDNGMVCLLELTRPLAWLDCVFGLLDGWWRFEDDRTYALTHEHDWRTRLESAGFKNVDWTADNSSESEYFRLIVAWH